MHFEKTLGRLSHRHLKRVHGHFSLGFFIAQTLSEMISILLGVSVLLWVCSDICGGSTIPPGGSDLSTTPAPPHSNLSFPASQDAGMPLSDARIQCQVSTTEAGPDYTSCLDAFSSFQSWDDHVPGIIGRRGTGGNYAHNLPWRWISRDGHCTFDVVLRGAAPFEEATGVELARSAWKLMNECVRDKGAIQGIASGIGTFYKPTHLFNSKFSVQAPPSSYPIFGE